MKFPKPVLASLLGFSIMLTGCHREAPSPAPENVTLLIEDENRILTLGFSEYLAGCIFAAADPSFQEETLLAAGIALSSQAQYCMQNCEADFGADLADRGDITRTGFRLMCWRNLKASGTRCLTLHAHLLRAYTNWYAIIQTNAARRLSWWASARIPK